MDPATERAALEETMQRAPLRQWSIVFGMRPDGTLEIRYAPGDRTAVGALPDPPGDLRTWARGECRAIAEAVAAREGSPVLKYCEYQTTEQGCPGDDVWAVGAKWWTT
jgi:hypothetical protein